MKGKIMAINGWMYDQNDFPLDQCIYVVAKNKADIEVKMTDEELSKYKYYLYVHSTHFFTEFEMPKFPILFLKDWELDSKSRDTDFIMTNFAVKYGVQMIGYNGENGDLLSAGSHQKEMKLHGLIGQEKAINSVKWHPHALQNQSEFLKE